jgi:hypothetical protein
VKDNRITNLVIALDRVKLVLRQKDQCQNPPVRVLTEEETVAHLWNGDASIVRRLVRVGDGIDVGAGGGSCVLA